jgi:hypothetical protein
MRGETSYSRHFRNYHVNVLVNVKVPEMLDFHLGDACVHGHVYVAK